MRLDRRVGATGKSLLTAILAVVLLSSPASAKTAPANDFAVGAVACSVALGADGLDIDALQADGWSKTESKGPATIFGRDGVDVKLFISKMFGASGQCLVDGYAKDADQFDAIRDAIRDALTAKYGDKLKMPDPVAPGGQAFVIDDLMLILSTEKRPAGLSVRVTSMRFPKQ